MNITIYSGFSKEHNSTKQPTGGTSVTCVLKENTSLINPVFILEGANFSTNYVTWNNRHYFVDDVVSIRNGCVELHCSVDALASWKQQIGSSTQYVTRSASQHDGGIIDTLYPARVYETIEDTEIDLGLSSISAADNFIVGIINNVGISSGGITYYALSAAELAGLLQFLYGGTWLDAPATEISAELQKELVNPFQYIVSVQAFPCAVGATGSGAIDFGYWSSGHTGAIITPSDRYLNISSGTVLPSHPQASTRGEYLNAAPFTRRILHCYGFGDIELDSLDFIHSNAINLKLEVDKFNGSGKLEISNAGDATLHQTLFGQIGIPIPIAQASVGFNPVTAVKSALASGYVNMLANLSKKQGFTGIGDAVASQNPVIQMQGQMGSGIYYTHKPHITSKFMNLVAIDNTRLGRPLMQDKVISSLSGYIQVDNPDVDIPATTQEKDIIMNYMQSGFYYE